MGTVTVTTQSQILHHITAFITGVIYQSELRHRLIETLHRETPISNQVTLKQLNLAADALESAISFSSSAIRTSSLSLAEKLLLPLPEYPVSSFLLSLILTLRNRPDESAISLLQIFHSNPSLARSEIAPSLYEHLFYLHLFPVFRWFDEQRTRILPSSSETLRRNTGDYSVSDESVVVMPYAKLLSNVSGDQVSKLRELEREYEEVLDENCRVLAVYFKEVLVNKDEDATVSPPLLILKSNAGADGDDNGGEHRKEDMQIPLLENGRYNVMFVFFICLRICYFFFSNQLSIVHVCCANFITSLYNLVQDTRYIKA